MKNKSEMNRRISTNKTIEKVFANARPMATCMRKYKNGSSDFLAIEFNSIKQIRGLNFIKVEFDTNEYSILAEVDAQMLM